MSKFLLDDKNLARQPLFWISALVPFFSFLYFGYFSWKDYSFGLSQQAYENFISISKFPLLCLSLSVPLVAIVAHIHRTIQTERQISHTQKQIENTQKQIALLEEKNKPDSYYAHVKSITEAITLIPGFKVSRINSDSKTDVSIKYPHPLYKKIFNKSNIKNGYSSEINVEFLAEVRKCYKRINNTIAHTHTRSTPAELLDSAQLLNMSILLICSKLSLNYDGHGHIFEISTWDTKRIYKTSFSSEVEIKEMIHGIRKLIMDLFSFLDVDYDFLHLSVEDGDYISTYINSELLLFPDFYPTGRVNPIDEYIKNGGIMATQSEKSY